MRTQLCYTTHKICISERDVLLSVPSFVFIDADTDFSRFPSSPKTWNCIIIEFIVIILRWDKNCSIHFTLHWAEYWRCNATYQLHTNCRQSHRLLANQCFRLLFHSHTDSCAFSTSSFFSVRFVCTRPNSIYYFHPHNFLLDPIMFTVDWEQQTWADIVSTAEKKTTNTHTTNGIAHKYSTSA